MLQTGAHCKVELLDAEQQTREPASEKSNEAHHGRWALYLLPLTLLYVIPRLMGLDRIVAVDEPFWLGRSANFYRALWQGDFAATFQFAHPGVTTMWAGMVGYWFAAPEYVNTFDTNLSNVYGIHRRLQEMELNQLEVLNAARIAKIGIQTMLFVASLVYLRRLFGVKAMVVSGAIIAFDPFLIAHDQLLHVDGLAAIASLTAALALADAALRTPNRTAAWALAGGLAAIAWLTRLTALALIGVAGAVLLTNVLFGSSKLVETRVRGAATKGLVWLLAAAITSVILWPALWAAPVDTVTFMTDWISGAAVEGHEHPVFFRGEMRTGDPGPLFYPITILWRLSVAGSIGLILAIVALSVPVIRRTLPEQTVRACSMLLFFTVVYTAAMTMGAKKFDRYMLPVHVIADVIAAIGIVTVLQFAVSQHGRLARFAAPTIVGVLLLTQAAITLGHRPYYLAAYNPLLGGLTAAQENMQLGWGEGMDQAARWIMAEEQFLPDAESGNPPLLRIAGAPAPIGYLLPPAFMVESTPIETIEQWDRTDYYVVSIQQRRIKTWPGSRHGPTLVYLRTFEPAHVVWIGGVRYIEIWDLEAIPAPEWLSRSAS